MSLKTGTLACTVDFHFLPQDCKGDFVPGVEVRLQGHDPISKTGCVDFPFTQTTDSTGCTTFEKSIQYCKYTKELPWRDHSSSLLLHVENEVWNACM
jgi:hypothetical protein